MVELVVLSAVVGSLIGLVAEILRKDPGALLEIATDVRAFAVAPPPTRPGLRVGMDDAEGVRSAPLMP